MAFAIVGTSSIGGGVRLLAPSIGEDDLIPPGVTVGPTTPAAIMAAPPGGTATRASSASSGPSRGPTR